jgi:hypothetical protein
MDFVATTAQAGTPHVDCDVAIERASKSTLTYWLAIHDLTADTFTFEAAIMSCAKKELC